MIKAIVILLIVLGFTFQLNTFLWLTLIFSTLVEIALGSWILVISYFFNH